MKGATVPADKYDNRLVTVETEYKVAKGNYLTIYMQIYLIAKKYILYIGTLIGLLNNWF